MRDQLKIQGLPVQEQMRINADLETLELEHQNKLAVLQQQGANKTAQTYLEQTAARWAEVQADDVVMVDAQGTRLAGRHEVEPTAMFIHAAIHRLCRKACVLHTHMPYATALTLTTDRALDTTLSQNAMRFHGRTAIDARYNGLALDAREGERIAAAIRAGDLDGRAGEVVPCLRALVRHRLSIAHPGYDRPDAGVS